MRTQDEQLQTLLAEQAAEWCALQAEGPLGPQQAREFMRWLRQSPRHVAEYLTMAGVARGVGDAARVDQTQLAGLLAADADTNVFDLDGGVVDNAAALSPAVWRKRIHPGVHSSVTTARPKRRLALALVAAVVVAGAVLLARQWMLSVPVPQTYATRHGQERTLRLPDNTLVQLDSDSAITVRYDRRRRRVSVDRGQAYFEVAKDPGRPFSVAVAKSVIRDIGTTFDVFKHAGGTTVTVAQGRIGIWKAQADDAGWFGWLHPQRPPAAAPIVELGAGQRVQLAGSGQVTWLGTVDVKQSLAWRQGEIAFDNLAVAAVAARFNRYNAGQIKVLDPRIAKLTISGTFKAHNEAAFIAFLGSLPGVRIERTGRAIIVRATAQRESHKH